MRDCWYCSSANFQAIGAMQHAGERDHRQQPHPQPGQVGDAEEHRQQRDGGAEVRLLGDQQQRHQQ